MDLDPRLQPYEILAIAIRSEKEAADIYSRLNDRVKNKLLKRKLEFLIFEEKKHRQILERLFYQRFRDKKLKEPDKSLLPPPKDYLAEKASVLDLFKIALDAEKASEDFYNKAQQRAEDQATKKILEYLSRVERSHYFVIKSEIDLLEFFPSYYNVEEFHFGHEMVHVGP
jgi:rubrerythrin